MSILNRISKAETILEKKKGTGFDMIIVLPHETEQEAVAARGRDGSRFRLIINTNPRTVEQEIEDLEKELLAHGYTREQLDEEIRRAEKDQE